MLREGLMAPLRQPMTLVLAGLPLFMLHALAMYLEQALPAPIVPAEVIPPTESGPPPQMEFPSDTPYLAALAIPPLLLVTAVAAAACLRRFLAFPDLPATQGPGDWLACGFRLIGWAVVISTLAWVASIPAVLLLALVALVPTQGMNPMVSTALGVTAVLIVYVLVAYVVARSSLVAPATVLGRKRGFTDGWSMSTGHGVRLTLALVSLPAASEMLNAMGALAGWSFGLHLALLTVAVYLLTANLAVLAFCYRQLHRAWVDDRPAPVNPADSGRPDPETTT